MYGVGFAHSYQSMIHSAIQSVEPGTWALYLVQTKVPVQEEALGRGDQEGANRSQKQKGMDSSPLSLVGCAQI